MDKEKVLLKFLREITDILAGAVFFTVAGLLSIFFQWYWFSLFIFGICLPLLGFGILLIHSRFEKRYKNADENQSEEIKN